jgi:hypothetical protein
MNLKQKKLIKWIIKKKEIEQKTEGLNKKEIEV